MLAEKSLEKIVLFYKNLKLSGVLEIEAAPNEKKLNVPKGKIYAPIALEKGIGGYIEKTTTGYDCMFNSDKMQ
jgi:hypothetical protein